MSGLRWLALLPSVGGLAVSLSALTTSAPAVAAPDMYTFHTQATADPQQPVHMMQARRVEATFAATVWHRREVERRQRIEARHDTRQAARRAARAAAREAARQAAQAAASTPTAAPGQVGTSGMGAFEACVIARESGGNPAAVNPSSGAGGLFQFLPSTWASLGYSSAYPGGAQTAPVSVQEQAFAKLYAEAGTSPWASDGCA